MSELFHIVDPSISKCGIILIEKFLEHLTLLDLLCKIYSNVFLIFEIILFFQSLYEDTAINISHRFQQQCIFLPSLSKHKFIDWLLS